jgi:hypothetical protein
MHRAVALFIEALKPVIPEKILVRKTPDPAARKVHRVSTIRIVEV